MTDIVERLRRGDFDESLNDYCPSNLNDEAADLITTLRAQLDEARIEGARAMQARAATVADRHQLTGEAGPAIRALDPTAIT